MHDDEYPTYYPALPYTLITDAAAHPETGYEFVLRFDPEEERYLVYLFETPERADRLKREYDASSSQGRTAVVKRFDPRGIAEHFHVLYTDAAGVEKEMPVLTYLRNMEMRNSYRRDD